MWVLGISEIDNDAGAVLIKDGNIIAAANEERFSRKKRHRGVPILAIEYLLKEANISFEKIDKIAIAKPAWKKEFLFNNMPLFRYPWMAKSSDKLIVLLMV